MFKQNLNLQNISLRHTHIYWLFRALKRLSKLHYRGSLSFWEDVIFNFLNLGSKFCLNERISISDYQNYKSNHINLTQINDSIKINYSIQINQSGVNISYNKIRLLAMNERKSPNNPAKNNLVSRLYKSHNKKMSSSLKPINLPHLDVIL